ncbi:hypothetical protein KL930_003029 [Ogataea haglerorum]|uniref:CAP-Gly domain-containing protein n=1 Tax=Ogataea haglerorum TaxID=1937702 RepID=A0AAN6D6C2_9ASCO|nr:uncharacterized protein KL911_002716 [Ogataea haglerorum]KAG7694008.1 hypothetical protein KL915_003679 [Ogataea haglerorum]KAG7704730.1 hypothetical protein KL914_004121 [Ogataea haglerorum]KAG7704831.1 hypothetical protein KL950_004004 [Ogataea haglerorum]KAG7719185.1 hypothetical protein KL913_002183 [Ogataea haglerorum]KAG7719992.1 hypothetical protein KL949_001957 [Ogataea haglerorum]
MSIQVGHRVVIPGGGEAYVRYVGRVRNKSGTFAGVELIGESVSKGKNSGDVDGIFYFKTKIPKSGLFLPYHKLVQVNASPLRPVSQASVLNSPNKDTDDHDQRINELTEQNRLYKQQLQERNRILEELQTTVDTFEAILTENQNELKMKDARFERFKTNTDTQIKELIAAVETLEQQATENEEIYLQRLRELESKKDVQLESGDYDNLKRKYDEMDTRYRTLEAEQAALKQENAEVRKELDKAREEANSLKQEKEETAKALADLRKAYNELQKDHQALIREKSQLVSSKDSAEEKFERLENELNELQAKYSLLKEQNEKKTSTVSEHLVKDGELIATPAVHNDPAAGRPKWCGLCEREGHESVECPYENVMF